MYFHNVTFNDLVQIAANCEAKSSRLRRRPLRAKARPERVDPPNLVRAQNRRAHFFSSAKTNPRETD